MLKVKNPTIGVSAIIFSCILCFVVVIFIVPPSDNPNGNNNSSSSSDSQSTSSANTTLVNNREFDFAGIKDNGVIALFGTDQQEFAAELDNKNWQQIKWSPDSKYISVLGEENQGAGLDLFLYEITTAKWTKHTPFAELKDGISGYIWEDADNILFTQGPKNDNWVHRYKLSQQELRKLYKVNGEIVDHHGENVLIAQSVGNENLIFSLYDIQGDLKYQFRADQFQNIDLLARGEFAATQDSFLFSGYNKLENKVYSVWAKAENDPQTGNTIQFDFPLNALVEEKTATDLFTLCYAGVGEKYYVYDKMSSDNLVIYQLDVSTNGLEQIYSNIIPQQINLGVNAYNCYEDGLLLRLQDKDKPESRAAWLNMAGVNGTEVVEALDYVELVGR